MSQYMCIAYDDVLFSGVCTHSSGPWVESSNDARDNCLPLIEAFL